jgi:2-polyprenyl-3-methyl-5-hydroxy-6-metoxy-1,4-benzoquinol methylase
MNCCNTNDYSEKVTFYPNSKLSYRVCQLCGHCELIVNNKDKAFNDAQVKYFVNDSKTLTGLFVTENQKINKRRLNIIKKRNIKGRALEVGPGTGEFCKLLQNTGIDVTVVEHSPELSKLLKTNKEINVITGEFEQSNLAKDSFDLFVSLHVIEHVINPHQHLSEAFRITKNLGYAVIATPNAKSWQQMIFPKLSPNFDSAHLNLFTKTSLANLCKEAGWYVVDCYTFDPVSAWIRVITKKLRRIQNEDEESTAGKYSNLTSRKIKFLVQLFDYITLPVRMFQELFFGGNEIIIVCQKLNQIDQLD